MAEIIRMSPEDARQNTDHGTAVLVCAYESEEKFAKYHLDGAISFQTFTEKILSLPPDQEIIFYCN
jgi:hypothetical protein